ncbi:hypothetical protein MSP8886_03319 [Marinomonas spartinae]|uniref:Uncharacterized protein n=1 Tax=Marinomonas spartinae TaxID=1792290 RepID=A0A1A8TQV2_9GAMM|nr:hypothetical protein [Marinomonas spartinae]SBS35237.1 hypothetical protein MSP8886_03319 [Marinomonas spartinae]
MAIKKITAEQAKKLKSKTNWQEVDEITDEEIERAAKDDPDSALPTNEELDEFKPVKNKKEEK